MARPSRLVGSLVLLALSASLVLAGGVPSRITNREKEAYETAAESLGKLARYCAKYDAFDLARDYTTAGLELAPEHKKLTKELAKLADKVAKAESSLADDYREERFEALQEAADALALLVQFLRDEGFEDRAQAAQAKLDTFFASSRARFPVVLSPKVRQAIVTSKPESKSWSLVLCSKYYDFYSNGKPQDVVDWAEAMDLMYENYCDIFAYEETPARAFTVHLFGSQSEFMEKTRMGPTTGGFYDGQRIAAYHGKDYGLSTLEVLFHEGTHQFQELLLGRNMWTAQTWFIEGLAVYFESSTLRGAKLQTGVLPRERLNTLKQAIRTGEYTPLEVLIRLSQAEFTAFHYAHGWGLIYFFVHGTKDGRERFIEYFRRVQNGTCDNVATFEEIFDKPIADIEAAWKEYILTLQ